MSHVSHPDAVQEPAAARGRSLRTYRFGDFQLMPQQGSLLKQGVAVRLSGRAMDLLVVLVDQAGAIVTQDALIERVWGNTVVDEVNLRVQMSALRKALGCTAAKRYVENIPGKGYCFVARVEVHEMREVKGEVVAIAGMTPTAPARLVGRDVAIVQLAQSLPQRRFMSIVGPGGVGKSALATAVVQRISAQLNLPFRVVNFDSDCSVAALRAALAPSLGLTPLEPLDGISDCIGGVDTPALLHQLAPQPLLVLLESCESRIHDAAALAEDLFLHFPQVLVLAASREPLLAQGENLHRLAPLAMPSNPAGMRAADALHYPAIQLFEQCARARGFVLDDTNIAAVMVLCQRLDGLPLAITLAAGIPALDDISAMLQKRRERFYPQIASTVADHHPGPARQRSLWASLDWSYHQLTGSERTLLRRLSVFRGNFSLLSATATIPRVNLSSPDIMETLIQLVAKSLVMVDPGEGMSSYRLLNSTRGYAFEKLRLVIKCCGARALPAVDEEAETMALAQEG